MLKIMRVSSGSNPNSIAQAISGELRRNGGAEVHAIGAGAVNQAIKAIAVARGLLRPCGLDLFFCPEFLEVEKAGNMRTALRLLISKRTQGLS